MQKLKVFFYNNKTWIYTLQYMFFSIFLLILVSLIDLKIIPIAPYLPDFIKLKVSFSQVLLTSLAAAFLTITTFTFSTILTVLNTYASNFTPRIVENFINMKITLKVIGVFIGGFFYCVGSLVFTRELFDNEWVISGFVAIVYSIICIMYFIIFIQRVITKFQGVNIILDVVNMAESVIESEIKLRQESSSLTKKENFASIEIRSEKSGYLSSIDLDALVSLFEDNEGYLSIESKIGEYISESAVICTLHLKNTIDESTKENALSYFILQDKKIETTDYRYNITKLFEIALRAISPGINDPNTAIHCINKLGMLLFPFAKEDNYHIEKAQNNKFRIYYSSYSFQEDLHAFYLPLIHYGKEDLQVLIAILKSLNLLFDHATDTNRKHIIHLVDHIKEKTEKFFVTELEKTILERYLKAFA